MDDPDNTKERRSPFDVRRTDRDYSGQTISSRYLVNSNIEKSFFNGAAILDCKFGTAAMNNVEFCEATIERTRFEHCNLSGSDFVDSVLENVLFVECSFERGEWRNSSFIKCSFENCRFAHTTVSLCTFTSCFFDSLSIETMQDRAAYFNVFSRCKITSPITDRVFASRNFGPSAKIDIKHEVQPETQQSLEQMCLLNNLGHFRVVYLADVALAICTSLSGSANRRSSSLTFFSKIVTALTNERRISATSLMYLEQLITGFSSTIQDRDLLMAAMAAVLEIHTALLTIASEVPPGLKGSGEQVQSVVFHFSRDYGRREMEVFRDALMLAAGADAASLDVGDIRAGSTIVEMTSTALLTTGTLLTGLTFVLRQAKTVIDSATEVKRATLRYKKVAAKTRSRNAIAVPARSKVAAIFQPESAIPELGRIRQAVDQNGRLLTDLDEGAKTRMLIKHRD
jgi:hypothetical protein